MLKIKKLHRFALLPVKKPGDAGYDIYSCKEAVIQPKDRMLIRTGIASEFPSDYVARICDRSGMATKEGFHVMAGVIDASYRGEWKILLYNSTNQRKVLDAQTRIAQVLFYKVADFPVMEVDSLSSTQRGIRGFGSTGEK